MIMPPTFGERQRQRRLAARRRACNEDDRSARPVRRPFRRSDRTACSHVATLISAPARRRDRCLGRGWARFLRRPPGRLARSRACAVDIAFCRRFVDAEPAPKRGAAQGAVGLRDIIGGRAGRCRLAAGRRPPQEAAARRHGFHHDRPGMHRRTCRLCRRSKRGSRRSPSAPCAATSPSSRRCASASRCSRACRSRPSTTVIAKRITLTPGGRDAGRHHARQWRLHLHGLRRLHAVYRPHRRDDRLR